MTKTVTLSEAEFYKLRALSADLRALGLEAKVASLEAKLAAGEISQQREAHLADLQKRHDLPSLPPKFVLRDETLTLEFECADAAHGQGHET